jgi:hypothetical protein
LFWSYIFEVKLSFILLIIMFSAPIIRRSNLFRWTELWSFLSLSLSLSLMGFRFSQGNHDFGERWKLGLEMDLIKQRLNLCGFLLVFF